MRIAERQEQVLAPQLNLITYAFDLEIARESSGHTFNHPCDMRTREAVQSTHLLFVIRSRKRERIILHHRCDRWVNGKREFTLWPLNRANRGVELYVDGTRNGDEFFSYS